LYVQLSYENADTLPTWLWRICNLDGEDSNGSRLQAGFIRTEGLGQHCCLAPNQIRDCFVLEKKDLKKERSNILKGSLKVIRD